MQSLQPTSQPAPRAAGALVRQLRLWAPLGLLVLIIVLPTCVGAAGPATVEPGASCVTAQCHANEVSSKYLHWPGFAEDCRSCHVQQGTKHSFEPAGSVAKCMECHDDVAENISTRKYVHATVKERKCFDCHQPHGSQTRGLLNTPTQLDLCLRCHEKKKKKILGAKFLHGPAEQGACSMCHEPHAAKNRKLVIKSTPELCFECHEDFASAWKQAKYHHDDPDCIDCHDPHGGPEKRMLFAQGRELCGECHDDIVDIVERAPVDHAPTKDGRDCLNCHTPHASNARPNLLAPQKELCLGCHDKKIDEPDQKRPLMNMKALLVTNENWHKPIRDSFCTGCHRPHGSKYFRILKKPFPPTFYSPFDPKNYALCFSCHEQTIVRDAKTRTLTKFRDGDKNLHFLHVNKEERGRTCRACHEVHASKHPYHIRDEVPYGKWMMPIGYKKTANGGSCDPGCHDRRSYDREKQ